MNFIFFIGLFFSIKLNFIISYPQNDRLQSKRAGYNFSLSAFNFEDYGSAIPNGGTNNNNGLNTRSNIQSTNTQGGAQDTQHTSINLMKYNPKIQPPCAIKNSYVCNKTNDEDYPVDYVQHLIDSNRLKSLLGRFVYNDEKLLYSLTNRNDVNDEYPLCGAFEEIISPTRLLNEEGDWLFLPNQPGFKQNLRVEKCSQVGKPCSHLSDSGLTTECEQKTISRKLVALDGSGEPKEMAFPIPSCCLCKVIGNETHARRRRRYSNEKSKRMSTELKRQDKSGAAFADGMFVFPDQLNQTLTALRENEKKLPFVPHITNDKFCGKGGKIEYCTNLTSYPRDHIKNLIKHNLLQGVGLFGVDKLGNSISIGTRFEKMGKSTLCDVDQQIIFPEALPNRSNEPKFIIQDPPQYMQGVLFETCRSNNSQCKYHDRFPRGYKTKCKQKYVYRLMMAINSDGTPAPDSFQIPSCCSCSVTNDGVNVLGSRK